MQQVEQMLAVIKQKILDLEVDPTQPIDEAVLVRDVGGSLTVVRQVLDKLAEEGMVVKQRNRWHVSRTATAATMAWIFEVRKTLEGMCVRFAARRVTPEQVEGMEKLLRDFDRVFRQGDNKALLAADRQFHQMLYEASGNRFLARALDDMYTLIYRLSYFALDRMGSVRSNVEEHRDILEAVKGRDEQLAERLIQEHITHYQRKVEALI
jgi:DNA-binding GntR family transcriptional regulator